MTQGHAPMQTYAGVKGNNTQLFDLTNYGEQGPITGVRVFWTDHIVGLEFAFGGQSTGILKGNTNVTPFEDKVDLFQGDYITEIFGRASNDICCFGFKTAKGFNRVWGNPNEGEAFRFASQGNYVKALKLGATSNICYIEPVFDDVNMLFAKRIPFSNNGKFTTQLGKLFQDTEGFDDWDWVSSKFNYSIAEVKVWHDGNLVHGVQFQYNMDGAKKTPGKHVSERSGLRCEQLAFNEDERITKIFVRAGDMIDNLVFFTNQGRRVGGGGNGGSAYVSVAPEGHHLVAVGGGIGGSMHHITLFFDEAY